MIDFKEISFTGDEMRVTDRNFNVDVVRIFWSCYEVQLHGRIAVTFPRERATDEFVGARKVYEELVNGYRQIEQWLHDELDCDAKIAKGENDKELCEFCDGKGLLNRCFNSMVVGNGYIEEDKLWERYYELCCDLNPIVVEAFIKEAINEDSCLDHITTKDGVKIVTYRSPMKNEVSWEQKNWYLSEEEKREQAKEAGVLYEMWVNNPLLTNAWKRWKQGNRSQFDEAMLKGGLKQYPDLWEEFCEIEKAEGREVKNE